MLDKAYNYLLDSGIKPSPQRIAVMEYLLTHKNHPSAEQMYTDLSSGYPTLSRRTVYNTLSTLAAQEAILTLDLGSGYINYDGDTSPHAHFICTRCGAIHDLVPDDNLAATYGTKPPQGFTFTSVQLTYKGVCEKCNKTDNYINN
jgi:Fur family ferric uptake transcriptional regulator/Fur family peroxide stress response transcriptional regulator